MTTSVAIALYNGSKYIIEQLDSIKEQSVKVDEVIIVDDCSTDGSYEIVRKYIEDNALNDTWSLVKNEENLGFIKTFRKAIAYTNNELIFLCDQDDAWMPDKVKRYLEIMSKNELIQLLASTFDGMDDNSKYIDVRSPIFTENHGLILMQHFGINTLNEIKFKTIAERNISMGCSMAFRRTIALKYLEYSKQTIPHDWELAFLASMDNGLYFIKECLIKYRIHSANTIGVKVSSEDISKEYRVTEYDKYIEVYKYFLTNYSSFISSSKREYIQKLVYFYTERINCIKGKKKIKSIFNAIRYSRSIGKTAATVLMDI